MLLTSGYPKCLSHINVKEQYLCNKLSDIKDTTFIWCRSMQINSYAWQPICICRWIGTDKKFVCIDDDMLQPLYIYCLLMLSFFLLQNKLILCVRKFWWGKILANGLIGGYNISEWATYIATNIYKRSNWRVKHWQMVFYSSNL